MVDYVNHGVGSDRTANCLMCSLGGVLNKNTDQVQTMMRATGQSDDAVSKAFGHSALNADAQLQAVINSTIGFVQGHSQLKGYQFGLWSNFKTHDQITDYMRKTDAGTRFCVWGYETDEMAGLGAHWNYAENTGGGIEFRDYQYNVNAGKPPKVGSHFFAPMDSGEDDEDYNSFIVLYFGTTRSG